MLKDEHSSYDTRLKALRADKKQTKHSVSVSDSSDVVVSDCCIQTNIHEGNQASIELSGMRF